MCLMDHAKPGLLNDESLPQSYIFVPRCSTSSTLDEFVRETYQILKVNLLCHFLSSLLHSRSLMAFSDLVQIVSI